MDRRWSALCAAALAVRMFFVLIWAELAPGILLDGGGLFSPSRAGEPGPREIPAAADKPAEEPRTSPSPAPLPEAVAEPSAAPSPEAPFPPEEELLLNRTGFAPDLEALSAEPLSQRLPGEGTGILILHTHASEAYTPVPGEEYVPSDPYRTTDPTRSVIRVGDVLQQTLEAQGLHVVHDRTLYDYPDYTGAYDRSAAAACRALEEYPDIGIIIDLHRDALGGEEPAYKTVAHTEGGAAKVMLVVGTGENGLAHPRWRENLKLALALQLAMRESCPGLARPIQLARERYNQQLSSGALLLEVGTNGNTLSEAERAAEAFGRAAGPVFLSLREG